MKNTISPGVSNSASWSEWSAPSTCTSGCITRSRGHSTRSRSCIKQNPVTYGSDCLGPSERVSLCDTEKCPSYSTSQGYASNMCKAFLREDPSLETKITAHGTQPRHLTNRVETACMVHCKKPEGGWSVLLPLTQMVYSQFTFKGILPSLSGNILMTSLSWKNLNFATKSMGPVRPSSQTKTLVPAYFSR